MIHRCPCCERELPCPEMLWLPMAGVLIRGSDLRVVKFAVKEALVFDPLWKAYVAGKEAISVSTLVHIVYGRFLNGGPDSARMCVYQYIHKIKVKLRSIDFKLYCRNGTVLLCQTARTKIQEVHHADEAA